MVSQLLWQEVYRRLAYFERLALSLASLSLARGREQSKKGANFLVTEKDSANPFDSKVWVKFIFYLQVGVHSLLRRPGGGEARERAVWQAHATRKCLRAR